MKVSGVSEQQTVRCLLLGVACDMPASRKASGFLGYTALLGCTKCTFQVVLAKRITQGLIERVGQKEQRNRIAYMSVKPKRQLR